VSDLLALVTFAVARATENVTKARGPEHFGTFDSAGGPPDKSTMSTCEYW
jgi:hypothetical protein